MIKEAISSLVAGKSLTMGEAAEVMEEIMSGQATPSQLAAFLVAMRIKGETVDEISGMARVMRTRATKVDAPFPVTDVVGTGGDGANTFNISTAAAFVAAGAGLKVAKHGNRAASSRSGSADVLETLGLRLDLTAEGVQKCLEKVGICFMFAAAFHPAMKYAGPTRREIGIRTVFNILGPLTNPAGARSQVLGVADAAMMEKMVAVLKNLGCHHAMVVHGEDGLDEITVTGSSQVYELLDGRVVKHTISPQDYGFARAGFGSLKGGTPAENAKILQDVLYGATGAQRDVVLINAAAALVAGDKASSIKDGIEQAKRSIDTGEAAIKLKQLVECSQEFAPKT
jgi:anthranilate phosphoribosyltransferase